MFRLLLLAVFTLAVPTLAAAQKSDTPEAIVRSLVMAIYANDVAAYERLTMPHPRRSRLTANGRANESALRELRDDPEGLQITEQRPPLLRGREVQPGANRQYPEGTSVLYMVSHHGGPMMVMLVRQPDGWKVDLRWWIAAQERVDEHPPDGDSAEAAVRALLAAMVRLDRRGAGRLITDARNLDLLFVGAPSQREPSGVYDAMVQEMPLAEIAPGELYQMPSGRMVEGITAVDRKVLVGWFGPIEVPFVVRRIGKQWRVEAEPYFVMLMQ